MNKHAITIMKNFSYTVSSNLISMIISTFVILIVPKLIGVEDYGYWQLYLFYSSYVGFLHFGWNDGIYLRYGGEKYSELNKSIFFSQFWMLVAFQIMVGFLIFIFSNGFSTDIDKLVIVELTILCMLIVNIRLMLIYILQSTNRIKEYAKITLMEKIFYCLLLFLFLLVGFREYEILIVADIIAKFITLGFAMFYCKEIVFNKVSLFYYNFRETVQNLNAGLKLMFANIAGMLIIGVIRFGIERTWDVSTFGKVSLVLSISNLMMLFINALSIIMFPLLRRTNQGDLPAIYFTLRNFLMIPLSGVLLLYYPLKLILSIWLPQYTESLIYMAILFPMCIYEGKMALLITTYLKTIRKEKVILLVNLVSVFLSIFFTIVFTQIFVNLNLAILSIIIILAFRCIWAEIILSKMLNVSVYKDILLELLLAIIFILTGWFINSWIGIAIYFSVYGFYIIFKRKDIKITFVNVKKLIKE